MVYVIRVVSMDRGTTTYFNSSTTSVTVTSLSPYTMYACSIAAETNAGRGPFSRAITVQTDEAGIDNAPYTCMFCHLCFVTAASASPQNLTGSSLNSRTISLSWSPPPTQETNGVIREYRVNVTEVETGTVFTLTSTTTSITLQSLHPYYNYRCVVSAYTVGVGPYTAVFNIQPPEDGELHICIKQGRCVSNLSPIAPSGYPQSFSVMPTTTRSALLQWDPPNAADRNGIVTEYTINVSAVETGEEFQLISTNTLLTVTNLRPYTTYQCIIAASTSVGIGPFSTVVTVITPEDGKKSYQNSIDARSAHYFFS